MDCKILVRLLCHPINNPMESYYTKFINTFIQRLLANIGPSLMVVNKLE